MRTKIITKSRVLGFHPLDVYSNWLTYFDNMNFIQYLTKFEYEKYNIPLKNVMVKMT
jgi:hypothetical protein